MHNKHIHIGITSTRKYTGIRIHNTYIESNRQTRPSAHIHLYTHIYMPTAQRIICNLASYKQFAGLVWEKLRLVQVLINLLLENGQGKNEMRWEYYKFSSYERFIVHCVRRNGYVSGPFASSAWRKYMVNYTITKIWIGYGGEKSHAHIISQYRNFLV